MEDKLPPILEDAVLREVLAHADMKRSKELQMVSYIGKNCVHGSRAHDNEWLDRGDSTKQTANAEVPQTNSTRNAESLGLSRN